MGGRHGREYRRHYVPIGYVNSAWENVAAVLDQSQTEADEIAAGGGGALLGEATEVGLADGNRTDWKPNRYGPQPSQVAPTVWQDAEQSLLAVAGVPVELVAPTSGTRCQ